MTGCLKRLSHDAIGSEDPSFRREDARPGAAGTPLRLLQFLGQEAAAHGLPRSRDRPLKRRRAVVLALSLDVKLRERSSQLRLRRPGEAGCAGNELTAYQNPNSQPRAAPPRNDCFGMLVQGHSSSATSCSSLLLDSFASGQRALLAVGCLSTGQVASNFQKAHIHDASC